MVRLYGKEFKLEDLPMYGVTTGKEGIVKKLKEARENWMDYLIWTKGSNQIRIGRLVFFRTDFRAMFNKMQRVGLYKYHDCTCRCTKGCGVGVVLPFVGVRLECV